MNLTWRPPGWRSDPQVPVPVVAELALAARAKQKRREPLTDADLAVLHDEGLLRQSYGTPRWVWRLASFLLDVPPRGWCGDPYHNPWSPAEEFLAPDAWRYDGHAGTDGFLVIGDLVGNPEAIADHPVGRGPKDPAWPGKGPVLANGPHRKGSSGTAGWLRLAALAGAYRKVAAVVQTDVVSWYVEHGLTCDAEVQLGRMDYVPPPGVKHQSGNERCSSLLLWDPDTRDEPIESCIVEVRDDRGKLRRCPLRPGLRRSPEVVHVPDNERDFKPSKGRSGSSAC